MANQTTFKAGEGGRPKGAQNKVTIEVKEFLSNFLNDNLGTIQADFDNLESKERLYFIEKLLKYIVPIKADNTIKQPTSKYSDWTDEQLKAEIERISNK
jgi:hypothetical protein